MSHAPTPPRPSVSAPPGPFTQQFLDDCFYDPEVLFLDRIEEIDPAASRVVCRMPTNRDMPLMRSQRVSPRHPRHINGAIMLQVTGMLGFVHAYYLEGLRHADGWVGFGTSIHRAAFRKLVSPGTPMLCACTQTRLRRLGGKLFATYKFEFRHEGDVAYESEQSAMWMRLEDGAALPLTVGGSGSGGK